MGRLLLILPEHEEQLPVRKCGHVGCPEAGTEITALRRGEQEWELAHCLEHAEDGMRVAIGAGGRVVEAGLEHPVLRSA